MRACILLAFSLLTYIVAQSQDYPRCSYKYFSRSKAVSTSQCYDKDERWGKAKAFNRRGGEIYARELRRIAGHSSVTFTYYESGAVKTAEWSSAPDAGIQWYRSHTAFSEDGKITGEAEDGYDERGPLRSPARLLEAPPEKPKPVVKPAKPETVECAVVYVSEFWFTNYTPYTVVVTATRKYSRSETYTLSLRPKETLKAGQMILARQFDDPSGTFDFTVVPLKPAGRQRPIIIPSEDRQPENPSKETRRYYYEVRRVI